ncbi:CDP-diacylglycerol--glycerol-3-phosphate 3-phosphatidyltransferase [Marasmius tenuissimus]|nr:CDP-diacylglycerol--glycerol-3-phosphate 3-phosphatidyltransferase [Marasmius tenuissimus]
MGFPHTLLTRTSKIYAYACIRRHASTAIHQFHPTVRQVVHELGQRQPHFSLSPKDIRILKQPNEFYSQLLSMIKSAEKRIFLSSLYIGSEETELINALTESLRRRDALHLYFQLDLNRSTRPGASSTAKILLPLLQEFPDRVHASFFRSPNLRGIMAKIVPPRFNEGWGTWHAKIYGADDDVMISGANLNESYFTNRQDRYLHFRDQPHLSQYCFDFLQTVANFSYRLLPSPESESELGPHSFTSDGYTMFWPDFATHPHKIQQNAEKAISAFQSRNRQRIQDASHSSQDTDAEPKVSLFPIIQAGQFNIKEEEKAIDLLFRHANDPNSNGNQYGERPLVDLTSGYFGLYKPYQELILGSPNVDVQVIAASQKANGFYGSKGISGRIPDGYTLFEQRFMKAVRLAGRLWDDGSQAGVRLQEWLKDGWTYHAKGLWLSPHRSSAPVLTLFGSTNLNSRSAHIDTELSFVMVLPETDPTSTDGMNQLRQNLAEEVQNIRENAGEWKGNEKKVPWITYLIVALVHSML